MGVGVGVGVGVGASKEAELRIYDFQKGTMNSSAEGAEIFFSGAPNWPMTNRRHSLAGALRRSECTRGRQCFSCWSSVP